MDQFAVLSSLWKACDTFHTLFKLAKFSMKDLQQAFEAKRASPLLVQIHVAFLDFLFEQHKTAALVDATVQSNISTIVKLQNQLDSTSWLSVAYRYIYYNTNTKPSLLNNTGTLNTYMVNSTKE